MEKKLSLLLCWKIRTNLSKTDSSQAGLWKSPFKPANAESLRHSDQFMVETWSGSLVGLVLSLQRIQR